MRILLACVLFFIAAPSFAQNPNDPAGLQKVLAEKEIIIDNYKTIAYSNGTRLDKIDVPYATFLWESGTIYFDYGQPWRRFKETALTNESGVKLSYKSGSLAAALNLMHFNGWEVVEHYKGNDNNLTYFLLKKKNIAAAEQP